MNKIEQRIETYCYPQKSEDKFDFNEAIADRVADLNLRGWTVKQVSTTSFVRNSLLYIAYTLLIEK